MISSMRFFIHMDNHSIVQWTPEIEGNYKFKEITFKVAKAIEDGKISAKEVVAQISNRLSPESIDEMLEKKQKMNVRSADLKMEEQAKADNMQDGGEAKPFDIDLSGTGVSDDPADMDETKVAARKAAAEKRTAAKAAKEAEAKAAAALEAPREETNVGGVNV